MIAPWGVSRVLGHSLQVILAKQQSAFIHNESRKKKHLLATYGAAKRAFSAVFGPWFVRLLQVALRIINVIKKHARVRLRRLQILLCQNHHVPPHWPAHHLSRSPRSGGWLFYESTHPWRPPRRPGDSSPRDARHYMQVPLMFVLKII